MANGNIYQSGQFGDIEGVSRPTGQPWVDDNGEPVILNEQGIDVRTDNTWLGSEPYNDYKWAKILDKPLLFPPESHTHLTYEQHIGDMTNPHNVTAYQIRASHSYGRFLRDDGYWVAVQGSGDVLAPDTNTDSYIPQWNGENSKTLKDGLAVEISITNVDTAVPTSGAIVDYASPIGHTHSGVYEPVIGTKLSAFNVDFGTSHTTVAYGDHDHSGVYEPVISSKKTAFNVDFGTTNTTVAYGDHDHSSMFHKTTASEIYGLTLKSIPASNDVIVIEDSADSYNKKRIVVSAISGSGTDSNAIHVNVASEIYGLSIKNTPSANDVIVIEDSDATYAKKKVLLSAIGGSGTDTNAIHKTTASEIYGLTNKTTPVANDVFVIEDSEDTYSKKKIAVSTLALAGHTHSGVYEPVIATKLSAFNVDFGTTHATAAYGDHSHSGYANKLAVSVADNFVSFSDTTGTLKDSGNKASDFATAGHNHTGVYEPVIGTKLSAFNVDFGTSHTTAAYGDHTHSIFLSTTLATDTHFTTGFVNRTSSTIALSTRTVTCNPSSTSFDIYSDGVKINKTGGATCSTTIANTVGLHFVYFDSSGVLQNSMTAWEIAGSNIPVAMIYWNGSAGAIMDERHSAGRNLAWHAWAHDTIGARYETGLAVTTMNNTSTVITAGIVHDEDIEISIAQQTDAIRLWYKNTASTMTFDYTNSAITAKVVAGALQYDNAGTLTAVDLTRYATNWVYATNDKDVPIYCVVSQTQYNSLTSARAASLPTFPNFSTREWKLIYRVIWQNSGGTATYIERTDYREATSLPAGGTGTIAATNVSFAPSGNIAATNVQTALTELDSEKEPLITKVASRNAEIDSNGAWTFTSMGTAFNKSFGTGTTNIAEIGATLVASRIVETDANAKIISVAKNTGYNLATGTTSGTVATGDHTHTGVYEPVISSKKTAFNVDFGTSHTTAAYGDHTHTGTYEPVISKTNSTVATISAGGTWDFVSMGTAFNKSFGTGTTNIAEIGATLVASRIVETDANAKIISVAKNTGYNLATGTTSGTVATGDHTHTGVYEPVISSKKTAFNVDFGTTHTTAAYGDHTHSGVYTSVITSNTTLYVGTGQTYTTLQAALDYLADKMIAPNALVTISIVAGIYTNSAVTVSHANGDRIQIIGGNYTTYDVTSAGYPFTGSSGNYTVVLYTSSAPSVSVGQCVLIETSSIGWYSGCHRITSYGANYITVNIRNTSTGLPTNGIVTMTGLRVLPTVIAPNSGSYGLILDSTNLYNISNIAITGVNTSNIIALYLRNSQVNTIDGCGFNQGAYGIYLLNNSSCTLSGTNCIQDFIYGINITNSSQMQMASGARTRIVKTTTGIRGYNDSFLTTNSTYINIYNAVVTTTPAFGTTAGNNNTVFLNT